MERKESQSSNGFKMDYSSCQIIKENKKKIVTSTMKRISHLPWCKEIKHIFDIPLINSKARKESDKHSESWIFLFKWISRNGQQQFLTPPLCQLTQGLAAMLTLTHYFTLVKIYCKTMLLYWCMRIIDYWHFI